MESLNASRNELGVDDDTLQQWVADVQQWAEGESQYNALVYNNRTHHGLIKELRIKIFLTVSTNNEK